VKLDIYVALDDTRVAGDELQSLLIDMGELGFGRDASIGLGKYQLDDWEPFEQPEQSGANAWLTLAPCTPQGLAWDTARSFYQTFTRFGRHGDIGVHLGNPFKTPLLFAMTGAVLVPRSYRQEPYIGRGLGGDNSLSRSIWGTVHQGYAPVVGIRLPVRAAAGVMS
jgi:CRISPR-associated protein Csm4